MYYNISRQVNIELALTKSFSESPALALREIRDKDINIILGFFEAHNARNVLCMVCLQHIIVPVNHELQHVYHNIIDEIVYIAYYCVHNVIMHNLWNERQLDLDNDNLNFVYMYYTYIQLSVAHVR